MTALPFEVHAGRRVREHVAREGFRLEDFPTLLGAAGGPKWLVLRGIDRVLAPRVRAAARHAGRPADLIGASIGAWRFAAWMHDDPVAAIDRLYDTYTAEDVFTTRLAEFDDLFRRYIDDLFGAGGEAELLACTDARLHVVLAHFPPSRLPHSMRLGLAAVRNAAGRSALLAGAPERVVASTGELPAAIAEAWPNRSVVLDADTLRDALQATAAVPGMIRPVRGLDPDGGDGVAVDGGIVDYHFDASQGGGGFLLYPHFYPTLTPGWFDKLVPGRRRPAATFDDLLLLCPSAEFVATLPGGKVPDRSDPRRLGLVDCHAAWRDAGRQALILGEALGEVLEAGRMPELIAAPGAARAR